MPPIVFDLIKIFKKNRYGWHGSYESWDEARRISDGYAKSDILEKVKNSLLLVKEGKAVYERDSVLFDSIEYSWPLLSGLMLGAARNSGDLSVLDFGGSLGSTYYQNRNFLNIIGNIEWSIIEQSNFVACGKEFFEDDVVKFYASIEECLNVRKPNILILASVLQYIEDPYVLLQYLSQFDFDIIILDRTIFNISHTDIITIQTVNPIIYDASIPSHLLDAKKINSIMEDRYTVIADWVGAKNENFVEKGSVWKKK